MVFGLGRKKKDEQKKAKEQQQAAEIAADEQPLEASLGEEQHPSEKARPAKQSQPLPQPPVNPELQGWISALEQEYPVAIPIERLGQVMFAVFGELRTLNEKLDRLIELSEQDQL